MLSYYTNMTAQIFFIAALFPFVSFGTNTMDSQPHYIFLAILSFPLLIISSGLVFRKILDLIIILMIILLTLFLTMANFDFIFIRGIASYFGFFIALIVSIIYFERFGIPVKIIVIANIIYLFIALLQMIFGVHISDILVIPNGYPNPERGYISLTPEHTFFGIVLYFFSWILLIIYDYKPPKLIALLIFINILSIVFIAKSSMVIVYLAVTIFIFLLRNWRKKAIVKQILITTISSFIILYIFMLISPESRVTRLITTGFLLDGLGFIDRIIALVAWDGSINDRVLNAIFPYFGIVLNYGMPGGLNSFYDMSLTLVEYFDGYFWSGLGSNKILSFIGTFIYELGVIGVISILYIYWFLKDNNNPNRFFELILLFTVLNSAIAVAFSLIPILIAIMYYKKSNPTSRLQ